MSEKRCRIDRMEDALRACRLRATFTDRDGQKCEWCITQGEDEPQALLCLWFDDSKIDNLDRTDLWNLYTFLGASFEELTDEQVAELEAKNDE